MFRCDLSISYVDGSMLCQKRDSPRRKQKLGYSHASYLKKLGRNAAKSKITKQEFGHQYFGTIFQNCRGKLSCRVSAVINACVSATSDSHALSIVEEIRAIIHWVFYATRRTLKPIFKQSSWRRLTIFQRQDFFFFVILISKLKTILCRWDRTAKNEPDLSSLASKQDSGLFFYCHG